MSSKYEHECYEWDGMLIDENCDEITVCECFDDVNFQALRRARIFKINKEINKEEE